MTAHAAIQSGVATSIVDVDPTASSYSQLTAELGLVPIPATPAGVGLGWGYDGTTWSPPAADATIPTQDPTVQATVNVAEQIAGLGTQIAQGQADLAKLQALDQTQPIPGSTVPIFIDLLEGVLSLATGLWDLMTATGQAPPRPTG